MNFYGSMEPKISLEDMMIRAKRLKLEKETVDVWYELQKNTTETELKSQLQELQKKNEELSKKNSTLETILQSSKPTVARAHGVETLARTYAWLLRREEILEKYLEENKVTKRKKEYTTYPLKLEEYRWLKKSLENFDITFSVHLPAIRHILKLDARQTGEKTESRGEGDQSSRN